MNDLLTSEAASETFVVVAASAFGAAAFFEPLVAVVHGYASLIANNAMKYDPDTIQKALLAIAEGLERGKQNDKTL